MYDIEVEGNSPDTEILKPRPIHPQGHVDFEQQQHLEERAEDESNKRQIADMKFIRIKVKNLRIESEALLHKLIEGSFNLSVEVPLPDFYQKKIGVQSLQLNNYDVLSFNEFAFNSLSLYNFRVDE
jgi:hypothetical protein